MTKRYIKTPIGFCEVPAWIAAEIARETDAEVLSKLYDKGFIDPFRYAETVRRGIRTDKPKEGGIFKALDAIAKEEKARQGLTVSEMANRLDKIQREGR